MPKRLLIFLLSFIWFLSYAQQGNYKFNNFGNRSILLSGNVTGSVTDLGLAYYNPSRLTEIEHTGFAFNAKAYQLSSLKLSNLLGEESKIRSTNFDGVPSMAGGTFNLFNNRFAYSFISKSRTDNVLGYGSDVISEAILEIYPETESYRVNVLLKTIVKDDWVGLTWAKKVKPNFSLGVSLFGSVYKYSGGSNLDHTIVSTSNNVAFYRKSIGFNQESYGLIIKMGGNYHFSKFDVGLNINIPYLEVYNKGSFLYNEVIAGADFDQFYNYDLKNLNAQRKEPLGISVGSGISIGRSKLHVNLDYVTGLKYYDRISIPNIDTGEENTTPVLFEESRKSVLNFGAGLELYIHDRFNVYGSFTTDYNAFIKNTNIFDLSSNGNRDVNIGEDFIQYSVGIDLKLRWASVIIGANYISSSNEFLTPLSLVKSETENGNYANTKLDYNRWQFVVGFEIPFLEKLDSNNGKE
ncbi:hypothetical protein V8G56_03900 [Gaetbulibacter aquiaggeris]|uniref:Long-chain fatty acid transport protein n=1 Tax=Gaetbulibacter aquiaggeris TaxID=1735373 RepID=A0ABW7MMJ3_9FLAO